MGNVTKKELVDRVVAETGERRAVVKAVAHEFLRAIREELGEGRRIELRDFGVFEVRERAARTAQNPKTLDKVRVPRKHSVKFKPGRLMKQVVEERHAARAAEEDARASTDEDGQPTEDERAGSEGSTPARTGGGGRPGEATPADADGRPAETQDTPGVNVLPRERSKV